LCLSERNPAMNDEKTAPSEDRQGALEWHEQSVGDPACLGASDRKHYETIRAALSTPRPPMIEGLREALARHDSPDALADYQYGRDHGLFAEAARWVLDNMEVE
jgi:hypothetical protein